MKRFYLKGGVEIPAIGLGTYQTKDDECRRAVETALETGYRHIDTADRYGNHKQVAAAVKTSGIPRSELFITTKIFYDELHAEEVLAAGQRFLEELETDYIDLLLVHWPNSSVPMSETLGAMRELKEKGTIRAIGVSNFTERHLEEALKYEPEVVINQVELHPSFNQINLHEFCKSKEIFLTAYSPLGQASDLVEPAVNEIAQKYGVSPAQAIINWIVSRGIIAIPKSVTPARIIENFNSLSWEMDPEDIEKMNSIPQKKRIFSPKWQEFDR